MGKQLEIMNEKINEDYLYMYSSVKEQGIAFKKEAYYEVYKNGRSG